MFFGGLKFVGVTLELFGKEKCSRVSLLIFGSKLLPEKTLCKFTQIFPPKDLYRKKHFVTPFN